MRVGFRAVRGKIENGGFGVAVVDCAARVEIVKAVCLQSKTPKDVTVIESPVPEPGPGEVRLKVEAVGICGSDVSAVLAKPNFDHVVRPRILGHEFAATVDALGEGVDGFTPGDKVCAIAVQGCGSCGHCRTGNTNRCRDRRILGFHREGAMADYVVIETRFVMPLQHGLSFVEAALIEPLSVASRCVLRATEVEPGMDVIVSGCGIIGMLCALLARAGGGNVRVTGVEADREVRLRLAEELDFETLVVSEDSPLEKQIAKPVDRFIEASGAPPALAAAGACVEWGGLISVIATYGSTVTWPATEFVRGEQRMHGTMASTWEDFENAMRHLRDGIVPVDKLVDEFSLGDAVEAFNASIEKRTSKAVMIP